MVTLQRPRPSPENNPKVRHINGMEVTYELMKKPDPEMIPPTIVIHRQPYLEGNSNVKHDLIQLDTALTSVWIVDEGL